MSKPAEPINPGALASEGWIYASRIGDWQKDLPTGHDLGLEALPGGEWRVVLYRDSHAAPEELARLLTMEALRVFYRY